MWNLLTLAGALIGNALGDPRRWGLDAAAAAAFCALLWPRLRSGEARASAVLAGFIALLTTPLLPPGVPVILAAFAAVIIGWRPIGAHEVPPTAPTAPTAWASSLAKPPDDGLPTITTCRFCASAWGPCSTRTSPDYCGTSPASWPRPTPFR